MIKRVLRGLGYLILCVIGGMIGAVVMGVIQAFYDTGLHTIAWIIGIVSALLTAWVLGWLSERDKEECDEEECRVEVDPGGSKG